MQPKLIFSDMSNYYIRKCCKCKTWNNQWMLIFHVFHSGLKQNYYFLLKHLAYESILSSSQRPWEDNKSRLVVDLIRIAP